MKALIDHYFALAYPFIELGMIVYCILFVVFFVLNLLQHHFERDKYNEWRENAHKYGTYTGYRISFWTLIGWTMFITFIIILI